MGHRVIWALSAATDLEIAAEYIGRDSPAYAAAFVLRVLEKGRSLSNFAERGRVVPEFKAQNVREVFVDNYRLVYRIDPDRVSILALIHGRREFRAAWDDKDR